MEKRIFYGAMEPEDVERDMVVPMDGHEHSESTGERDDEKTNIDHETGLTFDIHEGLGISKELEDVQTLAGDDGYSFRNRLIESANDMSTSERLEESYRNDDHDIERKRKAAQIGNEVRDNKTKNGVKLLLAVTGLVLAKPLGEALVRGVQKVLRKII